MAAYHRTVTEYPAPLLEVTDRYFKQRPWRADWVDKAQGWVTDAAEVYGLPGLTLRHTSPAEAAGSGCYLPILGEIRMPKPSVVTLFHEFRHAIQHHRPSDVHYWLDPTAQPAEDDARAWSLSLFHQVRPQLLASAVEAGSVFYIIPEDLE